MDEELDRIRQKMLAELRAAQAAHATPDAPRVPEGVQVVDDAGLEALVAAGHTLFLDAYADWCGPCKMFAPTFQAAEVRHRGKAVFAKLDVERNPRTSQAFAIQSIPTLLVFKAGRLVDRVSGALPAPAFEQFVRRHTGA